MNRNEFIDAVATRSGVSVSDTAAVIDGLTATMVEALGRGEDVRIPGLITAERVTRPARTGRNPRTGEPLDIPKRFVVRLKPGSSLKNAV